MPDAESEAGRRSGERLRREEIAWLTTGRPDGQPQIVPVRFLWDSGWFPVFSRPDARRPKNVAGNARINLNLNSNASGGDAGRAGREAEVLAGAPSAAEVGPYLEKCREGIGRIG